MTADDVKSILRAVSYRDWSFHTGPMGRGFYVQVRFMALDDIDGEPKLQHGRKWYVSTHAIREEVLRTCLLAVLQANEHEAREAFRYSGLAIFGPHHALDHLLEAARRKAVRP